MPSPAQGVVRAPSPAHQDQPVKKSKPARFTEKKSKAKAKPKSSAPARPSLSKSLAARVPPPAEKPPAPPASTEDVFLDTSFGEDLPVQTIAAAELELGESSTPAPEKPAKVPAPQAEDDFDLGPLEPKPSARPAAPKPEAPPLPRAAPKKAPSPPAAAPAPLPAAKFFGAPGPPPAAEALAAPSPPRDLALERLSDEKKDFLELVSDDLYRREFGEEAHVEAGEQLELISFRLAQETYAVRLTHVQQIIKLREITLVPRAPEYILGVISLRGQIIPIFDLRRRLDLAAAEPTRETRIIVVMEGAKVIGLIVDKVEQVVRIPAGMIEPPPPILGGLESEYIEGIGRFDGRMLILLNLSKVLAPPIPRDAGH